MTEDAESVANNHQADIEKVPEDIEQFEGEVLKDFPEEQKPVARQVLSRLTQQISLEQFIGPIPPPRIVREYEEILPGSADRILSMSEREQAYRHKQEGALVQNTVFMQRRALAAGFVLALIITTGSIILISLGRDLAGLGLIIGEIVAVIYAFHNVRWKRQRASEQNHESKQEN